MTKLSYFTRPSAEDLGESGNLTDIWHQLTKLRYDVFVDELHQYQENDSGNLDDPGEHFLALMNDDILLGYISINTPSENGFRIAKYFGHDVINSITENNNDSLIYEIRGLTVDNNHRGHGIARLLMLGALKFSQLNGADDIIAMGHKSVLPMYEAIGMRVLSQYQKAAGDVVFYPMTASVETLGANVEDELQELVLVNVSESDDACYHGGASWDESGFDFTRRSELVVADVLDSPFPPCPEVMQVITDNLISACHESPPTHCEPLIEKIADVREVPEDHILVSSGSSSLMFSLLPKLLNSQSRVLVLSPMYGEYLHILTHLIACNVTHFPLYPEDKFVIPSDDFVSLARQHDAVIMVNPNSPTGIYADDLVDVVERILSKDDAHSECKMIWVDETYIDYVAGAKSLESLTQSHEELIICKSMSKCYALSGLRVAYAVTSKAQNLRRFIPPWAVSLPAQLGAIAALDNPDYYQQQYSNVHQNREELNLQLIDMGFTTYPSVANYILTELPKSVDYSSQQFIMQCRAYDIFIRDAENMGITLDSRYVRFAVRSRAENNRVIDCLAKVLSVD